MPTVWRLMTWQMRYLVLRSFILFQIPIPVQRFLEPEETNIGLIRLYIQNLLSQQVYLHRPQTKLREDNVFTPVCQSFCSRGGGGDVHLLDRHPSPLGRHPQTVTPHPTGQTPIPCPRDGH